MIRQLPDQVAAGHAVGDDSEAVQRHVVVRADSAGCTEGFLSACHQRNVGFYVTARSNQQVTAAIDDAIGFTQVWLPALDHRNEARDDGAAVVAPEPSSRPDRPNRPTQISTVKNQG